MPPEKDQNQQESPIYSVNKENAGQSSPSLLEELLKKNEKAEPATQASSENVFTKLFGKSRDSATTTQAPSEGTDGILPPGGLSALLGPKPVFSSKAFMEAEKKRTKIAKAVFQISLVLMVGVYGFFYSQLNPDFTWFAKQLGPNVAARFDSTNIELKKIQTNLNNLHYRMARLWLDQVNSLIDPFMRQSAMVNSTTASAEEKQNAAAQLQIVGAEIKKELLEVQKIFVQPLGIATYARQPVSADEREQMYADDLTAQLNSEKSNLLGTNVEQNQNDIRAIDNIIRLVGNKEFRSYVAHQDLGKISETEFATMLGRIRQQGTDELSSIEKIRSSRLNWTTLIDRIHTVTRKADELYGQGLFQTIGGFLYSSYRFNSKTGRISITGFTKTPDSKTFSLVANLVDSIEKSPYFKDIDFRSFSKSRDEKGDYSSAVNLEFSIQPDGQKDPRDE